MPACCRTQAGCLVELTTMATKTTTVDKADASTNVHQRADRAFDAFMVGIDDDGREHYYSRIRDCVTVCEDGQYRTQSLNGRPLKDWMAFVEQISHN